MARHPTPVLFLSSFFDKEGTYSRADAIAAGALDVVEKPALMPDWRWHNAAGKLVQKVKSLSKVPVIAPPPEDDWSNGVTGNVHRIGLEESRHFPMLDEAAKFNRLLSDFLALKSGEDLTNLGLKEEWKRRVR